MLISFERDSALYVARADPDKGGLCGPRIAREGAQQNLPQAHPRGFEQRSPV